MKNARIIRMLQDRKLLQDTRIQEKKLTGGVSSDIYRISDGTRELVVKQARDQLDVEDDWFADPGRNRIEMEFALFLEKTLPGSVPGVLYANREQNYFVMESLDSSYQNWKEQLLAGDFQNETAARAADLLADLHNKTFENPEAEKKFHSKAFFKSLRTEPYLRTTGERHPRLKHLFLAEADRLERCGQALVHGDFSPKNLMAGPGHVVLLDHEVAHYGDPSFDIAFFLNHLFLKRLVHSKKIRTLPDLPRIVWKRYLQQSKRMDPETLSLRVGNLLLLLLLARMDGKSPVEYLNEIQQDFVREFVYDAIGDEKFQVEVLNRNWNKQIRTSFLEN